MNVLILHYRHDLHRECYPKRCSPAQHIKKQEIPVTGGTTTELGSSTYSSIFQEIILSHKSHSHRLCLHGFRNPKYNKYAVHVPETLVVKMTLRLDVFICKAEE